MVLISQYLRVVVLAPEVAARVQPGHAAVNELPSGASLPVTELVVSTATAGGGVSGTGLPG